MRKILGVSRYQNIGAASKRGAQLEGILKIVHRKPERGYSISMRDRPDAGQGTKISGEFAGPNLS